MPFWRCYYQIIWAIKHRLPLITPDIELVVIQCAKQKAAELSSPLLAINTVADHVHVAAMIPPKIAISEWVRHLKGFTTFEVNAAFPDLPHSFRWQSDFAVLSYGAKTLPFIVEYIERQKEHHAQNTLEPYLEQLESNSD